MKKIMCQGLLCVFALCLFLSGCGKRTEPQEGEYTVYYLNTDETGLVAEFYETETENTEKVIEELLIQLQEEPDSIDYKSVFIGEVKIQNWMLNGTQLDISLNRAYNKLAKAPELLLRAALVQTLVQIEGVEEVAVFVGNSPAKDSEGNEYGYMKAGDFVQNTGSSLHTYEVASLTLYFPNLAGDKLLSEEVTIRYNSNMSIEKLIVEQLMKGPASTNAKVAIPSQAKLLSVTIKDNVCYVNFSEGFQTMANQINGKLVVSSIVNSLIDNGVASQVQILINGESDVQYQGSIDLSKPLSKDMESVEEE